jgi:uncharacterized protein
MRAHLTLLLLIAMVFVGGALMAPGLYGLVQHEWPRSPLAGMPFHRYLDRSLLCLGLLAIWPLLKLLDAHSWADAGLCNPFNEWRRLGAGAALGFGSLAIIAVTTLLLNRVHLKTDLNAGQIVAKIITVLLSATVLGLLEEILFRGAIFGALRKGGDWRLALVVSSAFYATVHFMGKADADSAITWDSGLKLLPNMLKNFADPNASAPAFLNLLLAGLILGLGYQWTGSLYFSIGLHVGWIFWLRAYGLFTAPVDGADAWFWGTGRMIDGWLTFVVLAGTAVVARRLTAGNAQRRAE